LCPWEESLLHITTPCAIWDVGGAPQGQRGRPQNLWQKVAKEKLPHPVITLLSPVITLFTFLNK